MIADMNSRWAYPASQAFRDISKHGSEKDKEDVRKIIEQEKKEEKECRTWNECNQDENVESPPVGGEEFTVRPVGAGGDPGRPPPLHF